MPRRGIRDGIQGREDQETSIQRLKLINQASPAANAGWPLRLEQELLKHANTVVDIGAAGP